MKRLWILSSLLFSVLASAEVERLSPQKIVDLVLNNGVEKKILDSVAKRADYPLTQLEGAFDPLFYSSFGLDDSRAEILGIIPNDRDITQSFILGISKKWKTGSYLSIERQSINLKSDIDTLNPLTSGRPTQQYQDLFNLTFKQELVANSFGLSDRAKERSFNLQYEKSQLDRVERIEDLIANTLRLYWDSYSAQKSLKESFAAREKYEVLVRAAQRKSSMGFDDRGELQKTKAELQNQDRNVKAASLIYLGSLDRLFTALNKSTPEEVVFEVGQEIPEITLIQNEPDLKDLRKIQSAVINVESLSEESKVAENGKMPSVNFIAKSTFYGLDETSSRSESEVANGANPKYYLGLELNYRFGSVQVEGETSFRKSLEQEASFQKSITLNQEYDSLKRTRRDLQSKYIVAKAAEESQALWEKAISIQEKNHRVGRISTSELIMDYSSYFRARTALSTAIADYQMAIVDYKASRDQLVTK